MPSGCRGVKMHLLLSTVQPSALGYETMVYIVGGDYDYGYDSDCYHCYAMVYIIGAHHDSEYDYGYDCDYDYRRCYGLAYAALSFETEGLGRRSGLRDAKAWNLSVPVFNVWDTLLHQRSSCRARLQAGDLQRLHPPALLCSGQKRKLLLNV